jgi:hypothetical protein
MCFDCCFKTAKWKKEFVVEHKFDYINLDDYHDTRLRTRFTYLLIYVFTFRDAINYLTDLLAVVFLFRGIKDSSIESEIPDEILKWLYLACMAMALILLVVEVRKTRRIIRSQDISFAFTNNMAYRYYAFQDYLYHCFFRQINDMQKTMDSLAIFVFFRLKGIL